MSFIFFRKRITFRWLLPEGAASLKIIIIRNRNTGKLLWNVHMVLSMWPTSCLERFPAAFIFPLLFPPRAERRCLLQTMQQRPGFVLVNDFYIHKLFQCSRALHCSNMDLSEFSHRRMSLSALGDAIRDKGTCSSTNSCDLVADLVSAWCFPWWPWHPF